jgi:DNA repair exonuclease SbcCD ATPase subunit
MDKNYQRELIKSLLESKNQGEHFEKVVAIDGLVDNKLLTEDVEVSPFKKWFIKKIYFSNFLSYGENQVLDFEKCGGITVVESDPPNFGGKTVLTVDLLMFLFFNTTTKTQKAEEIFNRFTDKDKVSVRGEILIDGDEYVVSRNIERKKAKSGDWNVKTELDFLKKLPDGTYQNFTGEQRRETEKFIKNSIGELDDFLMTILTTSSNLEELIDSKPTARGQVLSRFMGLEFLKKKEEAAKEIYSEFSRGMLSNVYNTENLKQEIENCKNTITELTTSNKTIEQELADVNERLSRGQEYKDGLLNAKYSDIDKELLSLNPVSIKSDISQIEGECENIFEQIKKVFVVEPKHYYEEDKHDEVKKNYTDLNILKSHLSIQIESIDKLTQSVSGGVKCEHCGIELINAELTKLRISEKENLVVQINKLAVEIAETETKEKTFTQLKKDFDEYEKNKLVKEKYEVSLEASKLKLERVKDKLKKYEDSQEKIKKNLELDTQIVKAQIRIDDLINIKRNKERELIQNQNQVDNNNTKISRNTEIIEQISKEFEKEKIYKLYVELYGKNGISKIIMRTMMPVINQELQRLLQDS